MYAVNGNPCTPGGAAICKNGGTDGIPEGINVTQETIEKIRHKCNTIK